MGNTPELSQASHIDATTLVPAEEPKPVVLRASIDVRNVSLALLSVIGVIFFLDWAQEVIIPLLLGIIISYALSPLVTFMHKWGIPRALGAGIIMIGILGGVGSLAYSLSDEAGAMIETLPEAAQKFRKIINKERGTQVGAIEKVQKAATELEEAARGRSRQSATTPRGVTRVQIETPKFNIQDYLWPSTWGAITAGGQAIMVAFLAYFLMVTGDSFRRKLTKIAGPTFAKKKITVQILDEITVQIQRFFMVQIFTSILVGIVTWLVFIWIGFEHAAIWGIVAALFNMIPYVGAIIFTGAAALVALMQFGTLSMALFVGGICLIINSIEGFLLTPWLTGRASQINAVAVFVSVVFWGWLWGAWGLLVGLPIVLAIKTICDHVDDFKPIGEFLGE